MSFAFARQIESAIRDNGIRVLVRNGWELLAVITGERGNDSEAIEMLRNEGVIENDPVTVLARARLDYNEPLAIMPCSNVSGMTARLIYGDATQSASRIHGRPPICTQGGVVHLRELALGPMELPAELSADISPSSDPESMEMPLDGVQRAAR